MRAQRKGTIWEGQGVVSAKGSSKILVTSSSLENMQWEEEEPPLPSTSDTVVYLGKGLIPKHLFEEAINPENYDYQDDYHF